LEGGVGNSEEALLRTRQAAAELTRIGCPVAGFLDGPMAEVAAPEHMGLGVDVVTLLVCLYGKLADLEPEVRDCLHAVTKQALARCRDALQRSEGCDTRTEEILRDGLTHLGSSGGEKP
jgi:hypothetical protein